MVFFMAGVFGSRALCVLGLLSHSGFMARLVEGAGNSRHFECRQDVQDVDLVRRRSTCRHSREIVVIGHRYCTACTCEP